MGRALWWSVQTVTTVGYGDVTPQNAKGQFVAGVLMVAAIALISLLTASIAAGSSIGSSAAGQSCTRTRCTRCSRASIVASSSSRSASSPRDDTAGRRHLAARTWLRSGRGSRG